MSQTPLSQYRIPAEPSRHVSPTPGFVAVPVALLTAPTISYDPALLHWAHAEALRQTVGRPAVVERRLATLTAREIVASLN